MAEGGRPSSASGSLCKPEFKNGYYGNPKEWPGWTGLPGFRDLLSWQREKRGQHHSHSPFSKNTKELDEVLPICKPDFDDPPKPLGLNCTWIGHATVFVQLDGMNSKLDLLVSLIVHLGCYVVTDPVWSPRVSPVSFMGPKRYRDPPCDIPQLPKIDVAVISHNHYDHMDLESIKAIEQHFGGPDGIKWIVPVGNMKIMKQTGCANVTELSWGEECEVRVPNCQHSIRFVCTPAQHWSTRGLFDKFKTLWSGWAAIGPRHRFYFAGDTGLCPEFENIGNIYGPFHLAAIPIGCYAPRWFMHPQHIDPAEAVQIHTWLKAKKSIGIHWGTYEMGSTEPFLEPRSLLLEEVQKAGLDAADFTCFPHGKTADFSVTE